ncbi:hypothetical protein G9Y78_004473, partial [Salmonella enterica]|nr:hypothetical protein [Salmonella enterica]EEN6053298.1 hypothetical protein [Salmonella enterica subsp. enterica]
MKNVFVLSDCCFTKLGLEKLFVTNSDFEKIVFYGLNNYKEIIFHLNSKQEKMENNIIIVDLSSRSKKSRVRQTINIWNLYRLAEYNKTLRKTSFLLLGKHTGIGLFSASQISTKCSLESVSLKIRKILNTPENYPALGDIVMKRLCNHQKILLSKFIYGHSINAIAKSMKTHPRNIFYARDKLIEKLGLHDKY